MEEEKKCSTCGNTKRKLIEKEGVGGKKGYFCNEKCFNEYKKKGEESGTCEFC